jgi:hypothetical protein
MAKSRLFKCPYCSHNFWHDLSLGPEPEVCPICNNTGEAEPEEIKKIPEGFTGPRLSSERAKLVDKSYRQIEEGSNQRAEIAKSMGLDDDSANAIKITNMRDNLREGDVAAMPVSNDITREIDSMGGAAKASLNIIQSIPGVRSGAAHGPEPFAGLKAMEVVRGRHATEAMKVLPGYSPPPMTTAPALEIVARDNLISQARNAATRRR